MLAGPLSLGILPRLLLAPGGGHQFCVLPGTPRLAATPLQPLPLMSQGVLTVRLCLPHQSTHHPGLGPALNDLI